MKLMVCIKDLSEVKCFKVIVKNYGEQHTFPIEKRYIKSGDSQMKMQMQIRIEDAFNDD